jgi:DNA-binding MarR family transcriptional regulator
VRYALKILLKLGLIRKLPNLRDARQFIYRA